MIIKSAWEETFRSLQFQRPDGGGPLTVGETITAATVTATLLPAGTDATAALISDVAVYAGTQVRYKLKGGSSGVDYLLTVRAETSNGQKFEEKLRVKVG